MLSFPTALTLPSVRDRIQIPRRCRHVSFISSSEPTHPDPLFPELRDLENAMTTSVDALPTQSLKWPQFFRSWWIDQRLLWLTNSRGSLLVWCLWNPLLGLPSPPNSGFQSIVHVFAYLLSTCVLCRSSGSLRTGWEKWRKCSRAGTLSLLWATIPSHPSMPCYSLPATLDWYLWNSGQINQFILKHFDHNDKN